MDQTYTRKESPTYRFNRVGAVVVDDRVERDEPRHSSPARIAFKLARAERRASDPRIVALAGKHEAMRFAAERRAARQTAMIAAADELIAQRAKINGIHAAAQR